MAMISREEMYDLAGIVDRPDDYTPVTVGKNNKLGNNMHLWAYTFRDLTFRNVDELHQNIHPENVRTMPVFAQNEDGGYISAPKSKAIVGDTTNKVYAIHSDKYQVVQHDSIVQALAYACDDTALNVFGHTEEKDGRFYGYATIANPEVHFSLSDTYIDPVMIGVKFNNSHMGDCRFGAEIFGIRGMCSNFMALGNVLGQVSLKHYRNVEHVAIEFGNILRGFLTNVEHFKDKIHYITDEQLNTEEQEEVLWGLRLNPIAIENILTHRDGLNPEVTGQKEVSAMDLYNASTAYITYRTGSAYATRRNHELSAKVSEIFNKNIDTLIAEGRKAKQAYQEKLENPTTQPALKVRAVA